MGLVFLFTAIVVLATPAVGQQELSTQPPVREEPATKFERFLLSKGTVRVREFYPIGRLRGQLGSADFVVARAYSPGVPDYIIALRVDVEEPARVARKRSGVLDSEEVAALAAALPQMRRMMVSLLQNPGQADNTEVDFRGGSLRVGFFVASNRRQNFFVQAGDVAPVSSFFEPGDFPQLEDLIQKSLAKIQELRQR